MKIDGVKRVIRLKFYPRFFGFKECFKNFAIIGIGGNLGDTKGRFNKFIRVLKNDRRFSVAETSLVVENRAFGYLNQPDFLNAVINLQTSLSAVKLLKILQHYEIRFGRKRSFKNAPRTLDLDILYFSKKVRKSEILNVPHLGVNERFSVIVPLGLMRF